MSRLTLLTLLAVPLTVVAQPAAPEPDDGKRVSLAFDPGSHSRPISAVGFSKDQKKLITVGWDYSVRVWSTSTGEQLDVLRLPPYGRDNGTDADRWPVAVISADGRYVAVGGNSKLVWGEGKPERCQLVIVDVEARKCRRAVAELDANNVTEILSMAFSADGRRLVFATGGRKAVAVKVIDDVPGLFVGEPALAKPSTVKTDLKRNVLELGLSPSGNRLVLSENSGTLYTFDLTGTDAKKWKELATFATDTRPQAFAWTPDEKRLVYAWTDGKGGGNRGLTVCGPDLTVAKSFSQAELAPGFVGQSVVVTMRFLDADRLFVSAHGTVAKGRNGGSGAVGLVVDVPAGTAKRVFGSVQPSGMYTPFGATAGGLAATTVNKGLTAVVYRLSDGKTVATCGTNTPLPRVVGWGTDPKAPTVAWADKESIDGVDAKPTDLTAGFDLTALAPLPAVKPERFQMRSFAVGPWKLEFKGGGGSLIGPTLTNSSTGAAEQFRGDYRSLTLVPRGTDPPLLATSRHDIQFQMGSRAAFKSADGKSVTELFPVFTDIRDIAPSPDGRYVVMSTGTHRTSIYRTDGSKFPFLNLAVVRGEWVLWTSEGYYAASPGGEKLIGWSVGRGPNALADFMPADRYATHYRRPDVIKLAVEKGSVKDALTALKATAPEVETILPPTASLVLVKQSGATVTVKAAATSPRKDKPVLALRVLLDGRPLPNGAGVWDPAGRTPAGGEFTFDVPPGLHEMKVLARNEDGAGLSSAVSVRGPKDPTKQPTLYRVCVGVSEYAAGGQNLGSAAKDAAALYDALANSCVGPTNLFGTTAGEVLTNKDATRERVLKALAAVGKKAKPGDLLVVTFAGHGLKQSVRVPANGKEPETTRDEFYLVTHEGDMNRPLAGVSLSGDDLRKALADIGCPVLLVFDACHAAAGVKAFRPATDDLTRTLTDDRVGVTVLSAAMSHETAGETADHGHFTAALLKGLAAGPEVPYDPYERQVYVHHLYAVAFSEVRRATNGKQNPFLNMPWTMSPLAVREVPIK